MSTDIVRFVDRASLYNLL